MVNPSGQLASNRLRCVYSERDAKYLQSQGWSRKPEIAEALEIAEVPEKRKAGRPKKVTESP
jgi:hypothetical protein